MTRFALHAASVFALLFFAIPTFAQTNPYTWNLATDGNWNLAANWLDGTSAPFVPPSANTTQLIFAGATNYIATNDIGAFTLNSLTINNTGTTTIAGQALTFDGTTPQLTIASGAGASTISSNVIFAANTSINNNSASLLTLSGAVTQNAGVTATYGGSGAITVSGTLNLGSSTAINHTGTGDLTFSGAATLAANTTINLTKSNAGSLILGTFTMAANSVINLTNSNASGAFTIVSLGNSGSGTVNVLAGPGEVRFFNTAGDVLGNSMFLNVASGGLFNFNGNLEDFGGLTGAGAVTLGAATLQFLAPGDRAWSGTISGTGGINQNNLGTWTVSGTSSYTGVTTLTLGTIKAAAVNSLAPGSLITIVPGAGTLDLNNLSQSIGGLTGGSPLGIDLGTANLTMTLAGTTIRVFNGGFSGSGNLVKAGTGTQVMLGVNTFTGSTSVNAGTLRMTPASGPVSIGSTAALDLLVFSDAILGALTNNGGTFSKSGPAKLTVGTAAFTGTTNLNLAGGTLVFDSTINNVQKTSAATSFGVFAFSNSTGFGSGTLQILGNSSAATSEVFTSTLLTGSGKLAIVTGNNQNASVTLGSMTRNTGSAIDVSYINSGSGIASANTTTNNDAVTGIVGGFATTNGRDWMVTGTGVGPFTIAGLPAGTYTANSWAAANHTTVTSSNSPSSASTTRSLRFNLPSALTVTLAGVNNITTGGILVTPDVGANLTTIAGTGSITAPAGQEIFVNQFNTSGGLTISAVLSNTANLSTQSVTLAASTVITGLTSTAGLYPGMRLTSTGTGVVATNARILTVDSLTQITVTAANTTAGAADITFNGGTPLVKSGPGTLTLTGTNTAQGTIFLNEGTIVVNAAINIGTATATTTRPVYFNGGTLEITAGFTPGSQIHPYFFGPGGGTIQVDSGSHVKQGNSVFGTGTITKTGPGLFSVGSNTSTFSGYVFVNNGTFQFQSNQFQSSIGMTVNSGGRYEINDNATASFNFATNAVLTLNGTGPSNNGAFAVTVQGTATAPTTTFPNSVYLQSDAMFSTTATGALLPTLILSGSVHGPGGLIKSGEGALQLNNARNTYAGSTFVQNGILRLGVGNDRLPITTNLVLGTGSTSGIFSLNSFSQTVGGISTSGTGTDNRVANITAVTTAPAFTVNVASGSQTFAGIFGMAGGDNFNFVKSGPGTLSLTNTAAFSFTGTTTVSAGTLRVSPYTAIGAYSVADGAAFNVIVPSTPAALSLTGLTLGSTSSTLGFDLNSSTLPGVPLMNITGNNGLVLGTGTHVLTVTDTQTISIGTFTLIDYVGTPITTGFTLGSLPSRAQAALIYDPTNTRIDLNITALDSVKWQGNLSAVWDISTTNNWKLASNSASTNFIQGDSIILDDTAAGNFAINLTAAVQPSSITFNNSTNNYSISGAGSIAGSTGLIKNGTGTLTLNTVNTFTGLTTIAGGSIILGAATALQNSTVTVNVNGGLTFSTLTAATLGGLAGSGNITLTNSSPAAVNLSVGANNSPANYLGNLDGLGGITKVGSSTFTLGGTNTYAGATNINNGTLIVTGSLAGTGGITIGNGASLQVGNNGITGTVSGSITNGGSLAFSRTDDFTLPASIGGPNGVQNVGIGKTTLTGALTYLGTTTVTAGTIEVNNSTPVALSGPIVIGNNTIAFSGSADVTLTGAITGGATSNIVKSGAGTVIQSSNSNTFTGTLTVNGGVFQSVNLAGTHNFNATSIVINDTGRYIFGPGTDPNLPGTTFITINTGGTFEHRTNEAIGGLILKGGSMIFAGTNTGVNISGTYDFQAGDITTNFAAGGAGGALNGAGPINKTTTGTVTLSGTVTIPTATVINIFNGVLAMNASNFPTSGVGVNLGDVTTSGTFRLNGSTTNTTSKSFSVADGGGVIDIADPVGALNVFGNITRGGTGTLTKAGPGSLILNSPTYDVPTNVTAGAIKAMPAFAGTATFTVGTGASFVARNTAATGTVNVTSIILSNGGSTIGFELNDAALPSVPLLNVTATDGLNLSGSTSHILSLTNQQPFAVGTYTLIDYAGAPISTGFTLRAGRTAGSLIYNTAATQIQVNITGTDTIKWNGNLSAVWDAGTLPDVGGTNNWKLAIAGTSTNYVDGDTVTFDDTAAGNFNVNLTAAFQPFALTVDNTLNNYTFSGAGSIAGAVGIVKNGAGTLAIATNNTNVGITTINTGTLQVGVGTATGALGPSTITINANGTLAYNRPDDVVLTNALSGTGNIVKNGDGMLALVASSNAFTGTVTVNKGILRIQDAGLGGDLGASSIIINSGAKLEFFGPAGNPDFPSTTYITVNSNGVLEFTEDEALGGIHLFGGALNIINLPDTAAVGLTGVTDSEWRSGTVTGVGTANIINGARAIQKTTSGTVTITNQRLENTGGLFIDEGTLSTDSTFINTGDLTFGTLTTSGTLQYRGPTAALNKATIFKEGGGTIDVSNAATVYTFSANVSGPGGLTKIGAGVLEFTGVNTYAGNTVVNAGVLAVNNATGSGTGSGSVIINNGGKVRGTGIIVPGAGKNVTVNALGTLRGGNNIGTLTINGDAVVTINGILEIEAAKSSVNTANASLIDLTNATSILNLNPGTGNKFTINLINDATNPLIGTEQYLLTIAQVVTPGNIQLNGVSQSVGTVINPVNYNLTVQNFPDFPGAVLFIDSTATKLQLGIPTAPVPEAHHILGICTPLLLLFVYGRRRWRRKQLSGQCT